MTQEQKDPLGLVGAVIERRFQVESVAGQGGFGVVYRATQLRLSRPVALKVLVPRADVSDALWQRMATAFLREAALVAKVQHPNVVQILDHGAVTLADGRVAPWMALEWLEGPTLATELRDHEGVPRSPREILVRVRPLLQALAALHGQGIVHRDVKPANVMIVRAADGAELLKLLDLGIAKETDGTDLPGSGQTLTQAAAVGCSPRYAAPEQFVGARTGAWTDVYAAALVLVEMLVGRRAYRGERVVDFAAEALDPVRPTPAKFGVDAGAWERVIASAVATRPADRPPNAAAFLDALEVALSTAPVTHREDFGAAPLVAAARRTDAQRPPLRWIAGATVCVALAVLGAASTLRMRHEARTSDVVTPAPPHAPRSSPPGPIALTTAAPPVSEAHDAAVADTQPASPRQRHRFRRVTDAGPAAERRAPRPSPVGFPEP